MPNVLLLPPTTFVASTMNWSVSAVVGIPEISPFVSMFRPAGSEPSLMLNDPPLVMTICWL